MNSTASFCKTSVSEMTATIGISVLLGEHLEIFVLNKYQIKLPK